MHILLIGPPGSGKTTQGRLLAEALRIPHLSVGDEIRRLRAAGEKLAFDRKTGLLGPEATRRVISPVTGMKHAIIDGIPRTAEQIPLLLEAGILKAIVIHYRIDFETAMRRMRLRGREGEDPGVIAQRHSDHARRAPGLLEACQNEGWPTHDLEGDATQEDLHELTKRVANEVINGAG